MNALPAVLKEAFTFFVISADNYFSSIYIYLSNKTSLTKFCKKKNTVTIIPNFKLNTRNKKKWTSIVHKLRGNCFVLFIRSFWNVTDRRSERYAAVQRSYRINESACCPIDSPFVVTFFGRWPTIGEAKKKKSSRTRVGKKKDVVLCSISRRICLSTLVKSIAALLAS